MAQNLPDPERALLSRSIFTTSSLRAVATAVSVATEHERVLYVERMARGWRWSLAHRGGAYALLRISARFLRIDHTALLIGFRELEGYAILVGNPSRPRRPRAHAFIAFAEPTAVGEVEARILAALGPDASAT
jgi:hypothetical protein